MADHEDSETEREPMDESGEEPPIRGVLSARSDTPTTKNLSVSNLSKASSMMYVFKTKDPQHVELVPTEHKQGHNSHQGHHCYSMTVTCADMIQEPTSPRQPEPKRL